MRFAGIPNPRVGMSWNMDDPNTGRAVGETKLWLAKHATKSVNVSCMNPVFAQKLKRLMEAVPGGPPIITSGYRSEAEQNSIISRGDGATQVKTACGSYHPWGLAADFNNNSRQMSAWMRANARTFGITTIGEWDFHHFQDGQGKYGQCGVCSSGSGGNGLLPDSSGGGGSLSDQIRKALGMQQQPPPPPPPPPQQQPTLPPQQTPTDQSPPPTQSPTSTAQKQPTPISDLININTNDNTNKSTSSPTSTIDLIKEFLDPVSDSIDIGKAVDIDLNPDTSDATSLDARKPTSTRVAATSSAYGNLNVPQTFTTGDLSKGVVSGYIVGENTFMLRMLDAMKNTLLLALNYLKPFGGYTQSQFYGE